MEILIFIIFAIVLFLEPDKGRYQAVGKGWNQKVRDTKIGKNIVT